VCVESPTGPFAEHRPFMTSLTSLHFKNSEPLLSMQEKFFFTISSTKVSSTRLEYRQVIAEI
jgi:hypothetical protein